jgi:hypothetical protein
MEATVMAVLNRSFALALFIPVVAQIATACASVGTRPAPGEDPAEIVLPPTNTPGNLDRIRSDLLQFATGDTHSHTRPAKCKRCVVDVVIRSIGLTTDIVPAIGPARFRIIGSAKNTDPYDTEDEYSLKPGVEYLLWVAPARMNKAGTSRTQWGILELPAGSTGPIQLITIGYVERCAHPKPAGKSKSDADFKDCRAAHVDREPVPAASGPALPAFFAASNGSIARLEFAGSAWFDCGGYCCTGTSSLD